jgi:hypothetical protein
MMLLELSEATAARRRIPFVCVDATDGVTPETGVTFASNDLLISKNGAAEAPFGGTASEMGGGLYYYEFTQAELNTAGFITLRVNKSGVAVARFFAQVINQDLYGNLTANSAMIGGSSAAAAAARDVYIQVIEGTVETANVAATTTTFNATGITEQTADHYNGRQILFTSGVMQGSAVRITDYAWDAGNSEGSFTISTAQETPVDGTTFRII